MASDTFDGSENLPDGAQFTRRGAFGSPTTSVLPRMKERFSRQALVSALTARRRREVATEELDLVARHVLETV